MKDDKIKSVLKEFSLFKSLNEAELEKMVRVSISRHYPKGSHIFIQEEPLENVYFIYDGKIKIYKSDLNGKEQIVAILKKGEMFPHVGFFRKGGYPANSEVMDQATLVILPISEFEKVLIENPELSIKVFKVLGEKIVDLQDRLESQILNNTYEQIIKLLVRLGKIHGKEQPDGSFKLKGEFTNKDLANMIGTTRETVNRTLTKMKKDELIEVDSNGELTFIPSVLLDELLK
ncbi:Crp/Fnr family transcriptional regulator [Bacillus sp. 31A1R]|uniref:Crp/Fnr family transcriptional regulator n=1 Tax=Robertmurraya mangrovi TaxID=3098077 RepID=A0ABU5J1I9_9BACI|nr:Crp/Fnr family transcriptional regulator [Bacillus sp. 31A1R]MDZ5473212.1 Crp/Fnr family transcriptional regulator [Bacillus sp. 31A1R]